MNRDTLKVNEGIESLPVYEPGKPIEEVAREIGIDEEEISKLASNENPLGPSPSAIAAMVASAAKMHLYPDGGAYFLKHAIAKKFNLSCEEILVTNGSNEAIELLAHVFLNRNTELITGDKAFVIYKYVGILARATVKISPMPAFKYDLENIAALITPATCLIFIANPNNPTGTMVSNAEIASFMAKVPDEVLVCFDEAYAELLEDNKQPSAVSYVKSRKNVVVLRTFSKTYGLAGLRIGYIIGSQRVISLLNKVRQPFNVNAMALAAAEAALNDENFVIKTRRLVEDGLKYLENSFKRLNLEYVPSSANFILVKVGDGRRVFEKMLRKGIIVRPMDGYGLPEYIRVTVGKTEENRKFVELLTDVLKQYSH